MPARAWIGTSGWNYKGWRGKFYPKAIPQSKWLEHIAARFDTVELNGSFYRIPTGKAVAGWQQTAPARFRFSIKMWRGITHYRKLINTGEFLSNYFKVIDGIASSHRAPLLIQLPGNQHKNLDKLARFLDELKEHTARHWKVAVEFRHDSWLDEETLHLLNRRRVALCLHDMRGKGAAREPNKASFVYLRRHGPGTEAYRGSYSDAALEEDARRIRTWLREGRSVFCYFNNDVGAHAPHDALRLKDRVAA